MVTLGRNIDSLKALRQLGLSSNRISSTFERLSSGARITRASDDAAGLSVVSMLNARARIHRQAVSNANDGISAFNIAEGALSQLGTVVLRLRELATQAANGPFSVVQRRALDAEAYALTSEYNRIVSSTSFNGRELLNGTLGRLVLQLGVGNDNILGDSLGSRLTRNVGTGSLSLGSGTIGIGGTHENMATADFNGDGISDLAVTELFGGGAFIKFGSGSGTFSQVYTLNANGEAVMQVGDINGDGRADVIYTDGSTGTLKVRIGNGDGTFASEVNTGLSLGNDVLLEDLNSDGKAELITRSGTTVQTYTGNGNGTFSVGVSFAADTGLSAYALGDINGDGNLDFATGGTSTMSIRLGDGNGNFGAAVTTSGTGAITSLAIGDMNHDGYGDVLLGRAAYVNTYMSNGNGTFQTSTSYLGATGGTYVQLSDLNGDGELDIVAAAGSASYVRLNNGSGSYGGVITFVVGGRNQLETGDYNGDGVRDVVTGQSGIAAWWYQNNTVQSNSIQRLNLTTQAGAEDALSALDAIMLRVQDELSSIGSIQSRLSSAVSMLRSSAETNETAAARIFDADVAIEAANLVRNQILQQTSSAVLAQANQNSSIVLRLLASI